MEKKQNRLWPFAVLVLVVLGYSLLMKTQKMKEIMDDTDAAKTQKPQPSALSTVTSVPVASNDYKLIVGANPTVNSKQTFLPPTGSVVITNEAQLQLLMEQRKAARQQQKSATK